MRVAVICSSNMNRSMEAHAFLRKRGFDVQSYGTGDKIRLPGSSPSSQNVYDFGATYDEILADLRTKNEAFYTEKGILNMLDRNRRIKSAPERFQETDEVFDVLVTCEERVFDQVVEHFETREQVLKKLVHLVNIDIKDSHEDATVGSFHICKLVTELDNCNDLDDEIDGALCDLEAKMETSMLHTVLFY